MQINEWKRRYFLALDGLLDGILLHCFAMKHVGRTMISSSRRRTSLRQYKRAGPTVSGLAGFWLPDWLVLRRWVARGGASLRIRRDKHDDDTFEVYWWKRYHNQPIYVELVRCSYIFALSPLSPLSRCSSRYQKYELTFTQDKYGNHFRCSRVA